MAFWGITSAQVEEAREVARSLHVQVRAREEELNQMSLRLVPGGVGVGGMSSNPNHMNSNQAVGGAMGGMGGGSGTQWNDGMGANNYQQGQAVDMQQPMGGSGNVQNQVRQSSGVDNIWREQRDWHSQRQLCLMP